MGKPTKENEIMNDVVEENFNGIHPERIVDELCKVGLIQFDSSQPNRIYSVWGFGRWHHDEDILKAIAKCAVPPAQEQES